jgi:hypothetical protein
VRREQLLCRAVFERTTWVGCGRRCHHIPGNPIASNVGPKIAAACGFHGLQVALLFRYFYSGWAYLERGKRVELTTVRLRDIPVTIAADFCDPALDNLTASLDHLARCFCGADKCLTMADEDTNGGRLSG